MSAKSLDALLLGWNSSTLRKFSNNQFDLPMLRMNERGRPPWVEVIE
jgi:hypothetical protein